MLGFVHEHNLIIQNDWYNADEFRETGHVEWEAIFPLGQASFQPKTFLYKAGMIDDPWIAARGLETANCLFQHNVNLSRWTSARCLPERGGFAFLAFFFTKQEDLLMFKLFSAFDK